MKLRDAIFLLLVAAVVAAVVTFAVYKYEQSRIPPNTRTLPYRFSIAENPGVDVGTDIFRLGAVSPGASSYRTLHVSDPLAIVNGTPRMAKVSARGPGSQWLVIEPSSGLLPLDVNITLRPSPDARYGTYEGLLLVTIEPASTS